VLSKKHFEETNKLNSGVLFEIVEYIWHLNSISNCSDEHYILVYLNRIVHEMLGLSVTMSTKVCRAHFVLTAVVNTTRSSGTVCASAKARLTSVAMDSDL